LEHKRKRRIWEEGIRGKVELDQQNKRGTGEKNN
jgi:hypothetical protein